MQSSRAKLTSCLRKGCLLWFQQKGTATSNGDKQKLGNYAWHNYELITIKICSQNCLKWRLCFKAKQRSAWMSFDFLFDSDPMPTKANLAPAAIFSYDPASLQPVLPATLLQVNYCYCEMRADLSWAVSNWIFTNSWMLALGIPQLWTV